MRSLLAREISMKTRAAIAWEQTRPMEIEEIDLEGPKAGEAIRSVIHSRPEGAMRVKSLSGKILAQ